MTSILKTATLAFGLVLPLAPAFAAEEVNIYSYREPGVYSAAIEAFQAETGIVVNTIFADKGLEERIQTEGANSPADVLISVDIGRITSAKDMGLSQAFQSDIIDANVPAALRDPEGHWVGLSMRGRVFYISKERVDTPPTTYEELADPKWAGRICTRDGQHVYNIGLIAAMIAHNGEQATQVWLTGLRDNLTTAPTGNDRAQAKAIFSGECDVAIANTYYVGLMQTNDKEPEQKDWANAINVVMPTFVDNGKTHVNISGALLMKNAPNKDNAIKLLEYLSSDRAQAIYAGKVFEYPVKSGVELHPIVAGLGVLNADDTPLVDVAQNRKLASELVDKVDFNGGPRR